MKELKLSILTTNFWIKMENNCFNAVFYMPKDFLYLLDISEYNLRFISQCEFLPRPLSSFFTKVQYCEARDR